MKIVDHFAKLGLTTSATPAMVREAWKRLAQQHHPDKGGDVEFFQYLKHSYEQALAYASQPRACQACNGTGTISFVRGFSAARLTCQVCHGSGQVAEI